MTTSRKNYLVKFFTDDRHKELAPFIYEDEDGKRTSWFNNGRSLVCVNGDFTSNLPVKHTNVNEKWIPKAYKFNSDTIPLPTLKELKEYKKRVGITAKTKTENKGYILTYQLCEGVVVDYEMLANIVELLNNPRAHITNEELSNVYFENDNGEFGLLLPIRTSPHYVAYNILFENYKQVDIGDVPVGGTFRFNAKEYTKESYMDMYGNFDTEYCSWDYSWRDGGWTGHYYRQTLPHGTTVWVVK